jgi:prepilin-type N-terminal cleavage/methylation domain-containing protein
MSLKPRQRISDERGFSLTELLVAMFIGMIVLLAAFMLLDRSFSASGQIADRSEALQRGRLAMDLITRQLRSQVCVGNTVPMVSGTDTSVSFYADLSDGSQPIKRRTLTFNAGTGTITESVVTGAGTYPALTFTGAAANSTLLTKVDQILDGTPPVNPRPVFRYYGYVVGGSPGQLEPLSAPLSAANLTRVALIKIGFRAFADRTLTNDKDSAVIENDVYVRVITATDFQNGPRCI